MKKIILAAIMIAASFAPSVAQSNSEEIDMFQSILGAEKKVMVAEFLQLDQDDPFWAIYDEYEAERKALGKRRIEILTDYSENYESLSDDKTDQVIADATKQRKALDKLVTKYYKKTKKTSGSKVAAQFYHIETYLLSVVRVAILENIPTIGVDE